METERASAHQAVGHPVVVSFQKQQSSKQFTVKYASSVTATSRRNSSQNWRAGSTVSRLSQKTDIDSLRQKIKVVLLSEGHDGKRQVGDRGAVEFRLVRALLQAAGDPDAEIFGTYPSGVRIGVGQKLPRTPAVFDRKTAWRLESQADPGVHLWGLLPQWGPPTKITNRRQSFRKQWKGSSRPQSRKVTPSRCQRPRPGIVSGKHWCWHHWERKSRTIPAHR